MPRPPTPFPKVLGRRQPFLRPAPHGPLSVSPGAKGNEFISGTEKWLDPSWPVTDGVGRWKPGRATCWHQASLMLGKSADSSPSSQQALVVGKQEAAPRRLMAGGVGHLAGTNKVWRGAEAITHLPPLSHIPRTAQGDKNRCPPKDCRASVTGRSKHITGGNVTA